MLITNLKKMCRAPYRVVYRRIVYSKSRYAPLGKAQYYKYAIFAPCDREIWRITLKNNRVPLLCYFKLCASFYSYPWIRTGVTSRKRYVLTSVTLTVDLWHWRFAWMSLLSLVITPVNFMMIRLWDHSEKVVTDGRTDRRTAGRPAGRKEVFLELLDRS